MASNANFGKKCLAESGKNELKQNEANEHRYKELIKDLPEIKIESEVMEKETKKDEVAEKETKKDEAAVKETQRDKAAKKEIHEDKAAEKEIHEDEDAGKETQEDEGSEKEELGSCKVGIAGRDGKNSISNKSPKRRYNHNFLFSKNMYEPLSVKNNFKEVKIGSKVAEKQTQEDKAAEKETKTDKAAEKEIKTDKSAKIMHYGPEVESSFTKKQSKDLKDDETDYSSLKKFSICDIMMINKNGEKVPTDTYGKIKVDDKEVHYVRLAHDTTGNDVYKLIKHHWGKKRPLLAVSLIGEGGLKTCINKPVSEKIFESMEKVISTPRTCLISNGNYRLNQRLSNLPNADSSFMHLGIAHFGNLDIKEFFLNAHPGSCHRKKGFRESGQLSFSHTHLLLIDDGNDRSDADIEFRLKLENFFHQPEGEDLTQLISFAMGGEDAYTLKMIAKLVEHRLPLFVVKQGNNEDGTDYLVALMEKHQEKGDKTNSKSDDFNEKQIGKNSMFYDDPDVHRNKVKTAMERIDATKQLTLIDGTEDVDKLFLKTIMENASSEIDKKTTIMLYVLWNRGDEFWNENVFTRFYPKGDNDITRVIFMALALNRVDFLKSFRDSLIYKAFGKFTKDDLRFLYWYRGFECPTNEKTGVLGNFIEIIYKKEKNKLGKCKCQTADYCQCDVGKWKGENAATEQQFEGDLISFFCNINDITVARFFPSWDLIDKVIKKINTTIFQRDCIGFECNEEQTMKSGMFIWAVLNGMQDMANLLIDFVDHKCSKALISASVSQTIASYDKMPESLRKVYSKMQTNFENVAVNIVEQGYRMNVDQTRDLIMREMKLVKNYTCLDLAIEGKQLKFVSHPSVHNIFNRFWRGPWNYEFTIQDFVLTLICPFYLIKLEYQDEKDLKELSGFSFKHIYLRSGWSFPWPKRTKNIEESEFDTHMSSPYEEISQDDPEFEKIKEEPNIRPSDENDEEKWGQSSCCSSIGDFTYKLYLYVKTPKIKFFWHCISLLIFLGLLSFSVLEKTNEVRVIDWILLTFVLSLSGHEIKQFLKNATDNWIQKFKIHFKSIWNILDTTAILLFYIGFGLNFFPSTKEYGHLLLSIDAYIWIVRSIRVLYFFHVTGPYVLMIQQMLVDMMKFLVILFIFTVAHGVCFTAIMSPQKKSWNMLRDVIFHPYYNIYGELFFEEATGTKTIFGTDKINSYSSTLGLILLGVYVLIANVLLLNLLIAVFGHTFNDIKDKSHRIWAYQRYKLIVEYSQRSILVPPCTIIHHFFTFAKWISSYYFRDKTKNKTTHKMRLRKKLLSKRNLQINEFEAKIFKDRNGNLDILV